MPKLTKILREIVTDFKYSGYITDELEWGDNQFFGACRVGFSPHRKIELKAYPYECYHTGLLHMTGSSEFNKQMRRKAKLEGYKLNEYFLRPKTIYGSIGDPIKVKGEKEIFDALNIPYRSPDNRF